VVLIGDDAAPAFALLLEKDELAYIKVADFDSEFCQQLAALAVSAVFTFDSGFHNDPP
jgi:hypothetical protein